MERTRTWKFYPIIFSMLVLFTVFFASTLAYANPKELYEIKAAIKAKEAKWVADETSVSGLSLKAKKMRTGLNIEEDIAEGLTQTESPIGEIQTVVPPTVDWRNVDGLSYVSPVKNQGSCGSCWAFAVAAALESQYMVSSGGLLVDLSEQVLVSCSGAGSCSGGSSATASNFVRDVGLPLESCLKYSATNSTCENACLDWQNDTYRIIGWHRASTTTITVDDIKKGLYVYGPVIATMYVYNDFYSYRTGIYSYATGSYVGAHAVLVVGYDDVNEYFIVKNSWGTGWGEAGYFKIAYSEVTGTSRFGYSALVYDGYQDGTPSPPSAVCAYSLSSTGKSFKAAGGTASVGLYTQANCSWTATSNASWVSITAGTSGTGEGTIYYTVQGNTQSTVRTATLHIAGESYIVTQQGAKVIRRVR